MPKSGTRGKRLLTKVLEKMTEAALAKSVGVAQQQVSRWKHGSSRPKAHYRRALERLYAIPFDAWDTREEAAIARGQAA